MARDRPSEPEILVPELALPGVAPPTPADTLPGLATPLIGRTKELAVLQAQIVGDDSRLLTVLGPPGVGKTRLALEVAHTTLDRFAAGALFVDLAPVRDPALITYALARALGVREGWRDGTALDLPWERVKDVLRHRHLLLVMDNFEHVVEGAPIVGELLGACPRLKVLATSREPLRLQWEQQFPLGPLPIPDLDPLPPVAVLNRNPAVAMFVSRARAVMPGFTLGEHNARSVAEICVRLDGLALAIELVVGRIGGMPLSTIVAQLGGRLDFLTGGPRDLPARQQTMRSAIAWSYELLLPVEQALFRRLAAFAGGAPAEAIVMVCGQAGGHTLDLHTLSALVEKNLLLLTPLPDGSTRYRMLESLREFAWEQLSISGELDEMRRRHARFFLSLAETAEREELAGKAAWHESLEREHDNVRRAFEWALDADVEVAARFVGALRRFWNFRGYRAEGRAWSERVLTKEEVGRVSPSTRAKALYTAAVLARLGGDNAVAIGRAEECLRLRETLGDRSGAAEALWYLGHLAWHGGRTSRAVSLYEQSLAIAREAGDKAWMAGALQALGGIARQDGDRIGARSMLEEAIALAREGGEFRSLVSSLLRLGEVALEDGNLTESEALFAEVLARARTHGDKFYIAEGLEHLAYVADQGGQFKRGVELLADSLAIYREFGDEGSAAAILRRLGQVAARAGDFRQAASSIDQSLVLNRNLGHVWGIAKSLAAAAVLAAERDRVEDATLLLAASSRLREAGGGPRAPDLDVFDRAHVQVEEGLRENRAEAWASGSAMPLPDAIEHARIVLHALAAEGPEERKKTGSQLSRREEEVATLVALGLSNREIGRRLVISERTAASHVEHILNKLGFNSRTQIAAWAVGHGLQTPEQ